MKALKIFVFLFLILIIAGYLFVLKDNSITHDRPIKPRIEKSTDSPKLEKDVDVNDEVDFSSEKTSSSEVNGVDILKIDFYVANPSTGSMWDVSIFKPSTEGENLPGIILVPGGVSDKSKFLANTSPNVDYSTAELFAS